MNLCIEEDSILVHASRVNSLIRLGKSYNHVPIWEQYYSCMMSGVISYSTKFDFFVYDELRELYERSKMMKNRNTVIDQMLEDN